jgi:glycine/serine hydroxymethyltransferase
MGESEMVEIADIISTVIQNKKDTEMIIALSKRVEALCDSFPLYIEEYKLNVEEAKI